MNILSVKQKYVQRIVNAIIIQIMRNVCASMGGTMDIARVSARKDANLSNVTTSECVASYCHNGFFGATMTCVSTAL